MPSVLGAVLDATEPITVEPVTGYSSGDEAEPCCITCASVGIFAALGDGWRITACGDGIAAEAESYDVGTCRSSDGVLPETSRRGNPLGSGTGSVIPCPFPHVRPYVH